VGVSQQKNRRARRVALVEPVRRPRAGHAGVPRSMTTEIHVPSDVFDAVARYFNPREIVELTATSAATTWSRASWRRWRSTTD